MQKKFPDGGFEFLLVNDGSTDGSLEIAREFVNRISEIGNQKSDIRHPISEIRILTHDPPNLGKGWAVRQGMLEAQGDWILFLDCDLATPIEELEKFLPLMKERSHPLRRFRPQSEPFTPPAGGAGATSQDYPDILIGTRRTRASRVQIHQPLYRELMGKVFYYLTRLLLSIKVSDVTCGFKCYSREAAQAIFPKQKLTDWSYDAEDLFLAQKLGFKVKEIPVVWQDKNQSRVRVLKDALSSFLGLVRIRFNGYQGQH